MHVTASTFICKIAVIMSGLLFGLKFSFLAFLSNCIHQAFRDSCSVPVLSKPNKSFITQLEIQRLILVLHVLQYLLTIIDCRLLDCFHRKGNPKSGSGHFAEG